MNVWGELSTIIYRHQLAYAGERPFALRVSLEEFKSLHTPYFWLDLCNPRFMGVPLQVGGPFMVGAYVER